MTIGSAEAPQPNLDRYASWKLITPGMYEPGTFGDIMLASGLMNRRRPQSVFNAGLDSVFARDPELVQASAKSGITTLDQFLAKKSKNGELGKRAATQLRLYFAGLMVLPHARLVELAYADRIFADIQTAHQNKVPRGSMSVAVPANREHELVRAVDAALETIKPTRQYKAEANRNETRSFFGLDTFDKSHMSLSEQAARLAKASHVRNFLLKTRTNVPNLRLWLPLPEGSIGKRLQSNAVFLGDFKISGENRGPISPYGVTPESLGHWVQRFQKRLTVDALLLSSLPLNESEMNDVRSFIALLTGSSQ